METQEMVGRVGSGDGRAAEEMLRELRPRLLALLRRRGVEAHLAEDLVQEALGVIWCRLSELKDPQRLWSWAASIVLNRWRTHRKRRRTVEEVQEGLAVDLRQRGDPLVHREACLWVRRRLAALRPECRTVVSLRVAHSCPPEMAARILGIPRERVRRLLYQGMTGLRNAVANPEGRAWARALGVA